MSYFLRKVLLRSFDIAALTLVVAILMFGFASPAYAYVDPSVMTYTIQALAGVAVALSAVLGVAWRRLRRGLYKILKIDENANKVIEPKVSQTADSTTLQQADLEAKSEFTSQGKEQPQKLPWLARFILTVIVVGTFVFTQLVSAPLEIIATNASHFQFNWTQVWQGLAIVGIIITAGIAIVISLTRNKLFETLIAIITAISILALIQALFMNNHLPQANGADVQWFSLWKWFSLSFVVWAVIICLLVYFAIKKPSLNKTVAILASIVLVLTTGINLKGTLDDNYPSYGDSVITKEGLFTVSDKNNIIWLVLDTLDTSYLDEALQNYPDILDEYTGFTWFHNTTSQSAPTRYTVPSLVTGNFFDFTEERTVYFSQETAEFFSEHNLLDDANELGYSVGVYSDSVGWGKAELQNDTINVHSIDKQEVNSVTQYATTLYKCAFYRDAPWIFKPLFRYYTDDINQAVVKKSETNDSNTAYILDDMNYYHELQTRGLTIEEDTEGAYRFIHMTGAHQPFNLNANLQTGASNKIEQSAAAMQIAAQYLKQLKEAGVYENSTIIVCADHGVYDWEGKPTPDHPTTPLIMIKPAGADSSAAVEISNAPVDQFDFPETIREFLGIASNEKTMFDWSDTDERVRYYYNNEETDTGNLGFHENEIDGDVNDWNSWSLTGRFWPAS